MKLIHSILTLCIGVTVGLGLAVAVPVLAAPAKFSWYTQETVTINGHKVNVLDDLKRHNTCYITESSGTYRATSSSCVSNK